MGSPPAGPGVTLQDMVLEFANTIRVPGDEDKDPPGNTQEQEVGSDVDSQASEEGQERSEAEKAQCQEEDDREGNARDILALLDYIWGKNGGGEVGPPRTARQGKARGVGRHLASTASNGS